LLKGVGVAGGTPSERRGRFAGRSLLAVLGVELFEAAAARCMNLRELSRFEISIVFGGSFTFIVRSFEESVFGVPFGVPFGVSLGVAGAMLTYFLLSELANCKLSLRNVSTREVARLLLKS
jgi:hypothetical protein